MFGEAEAKYDAERIICALKILEPHQIRMMQDIVKVLYEICRTV